MCAQIISTAMNGLVRGATASLSRRFDVYEPLDRVMRSASRRDVRRRRSMSFKRKKVAHVPLRNNEDRAKQKRQIFLNSYKFESPKKSQRSRCMKLNKVARKVKTVVAKLVSSFFRIGGFRSCNCHLAIHASSPTPRRNWYYISYKSRSWLYR